MARIERVRWMLKRRRHERQRRRAMGGPLESAGLGSGVRVTADREYRGGYDDRAVEGMAVEDGNNSVHDPSVWGENTAPRAIHLINATVAVLKHLVGHAFRGESLPLEVELEHAGAEANVAEQGALDDIDEEEEARREEVGLLARIRNAKLVPPQGEDVRRYVAKLGSLVVGDLVFIALAFEVFGLSDRPLLGFVPFSSELHIAALSSVLALLFLAHFAGEELKTISHVNRRRREEPTGGIASAGAGAYVYAATWILGAAAVLVGISAVRETYLAAEGVEAHTEIFAAIQSGVFLAALALSISHAHPFAREWARVSHWVRRTTGQSERSAARHAKLVAHVNGIVDRRLALLAMAAQHARLGEVDAARQILLYVRRTQLSQPEPVGERLFPKQLPDAEHEDDTELTGLLIGIAKQPEFERLDTDTVTQRREQMRQMLAELRKQEDPKRGGVAAELGSAQLLLDAEEFAVHNGAGS